MNQFQVFYGTYLKNKSATHVYLGLAGNRVVVRWMLKDLETEYAIITPFPCLS
jgi:predicted GNAT superfamily acetyltransferase